MVDRLYTPKQVCPLIGVAHVSDVYRLIHDGHLKAKRRVVRGKGKVPRLVILESAVNEYAHSLPDNEPKGSVPPPAAREGKTRRHGPRPSAVVKEIEQSTKYV